MRRLVAAVRSLLSGDTDSAEMDVSQLVQCAISWHLEHAVMPPFSSDGGVDPQAAIITPVTDSRRRPLWSVMIPTYNSNAEYLHRCLRSVLDQEVSPDQMEIWLIDDASSTDTVRMLAREYSPRVRLITSERNRGLQASFTECIRQASGHVIHTLHQDDFVLPNFYRVMGKPFQSREFVGAALCRFHYVDKKGEIVYTPRKEAPIAGFLSDWLPEIVAENRIQFASIVVSRAAFEQIGSYSSRLHYALDWELWARIVRNFPIWYTPDPLAVFRWHETSATEGLSVQTRLHDELLAARIMNTYLPETSREAVARATLQRLFSDKWKSVQVLLEAGDTDSALRLADDLLNDWASRAERRRCRRLLQSGEIATLGFDREA